jgi:phosphoglycolate phosphatase-like HAD superfamily hydrolase
MNDMDQLRNMPRRHDFFIGFDSDGCVFDTMEVKHKECFCPAYIKHMGLQPVSKAAREVWDFVNLYSKSRGCNRFLGLQRSLNLLQSRKDVLFRKFEVPEFEAFNEWMQGSPQLENAALENEIVRTGNEELKKVLAWSLEINTRVAEMVFGMSPFPFVKDVLRSGSSRADMIVVSQTPVDALEREWGENRLRSFASFIAGQEHGTKSEHIRLATEGKGYESDRILMVGDAPGDYQAATENLALFYPIIPGKEEWSWKHLAEEGLSRFFNGTYAGDYQKKIWEKFDEVLPENPAWDTV